MNARQRREFLEMSRRLEEASKKPTIGMGATICLRADCIACTIVKVSASRKTIVIQEDTSTRLGRPGSKPTTKQTYSYKENLDGRVHTVFFNKDGEWRIRKTEKMGSQVVELGYRKTYDNPDW